MDNELQLFRYKDFSIRAIDIQAVTRPKGYRHFFQRGRDRNGFIYISSGSMRYTFHDENIGSILVEAGEMIFIPRGTVYRHHALQNTDIKIVQFGLWNGQLPSYLSAPTKILMPSTGEQIENFFTPYKNRTVNHPYYYMSCLYRMLWRIDEYHNKLPAKYKRIKPALREINEKFHINTPIAHYAELCQMSEATFRRLFREYTNQSPVDYRNNLRLQSAKAKLQSGEYSISEVAEQCGFNNMSFFSLLYKKKFGYSPKDE